MKGIFHQTNEEEEAELETDLFTAQRKREEEKPCLHLPEFFDSPGASLQGCRYADVHAHTIGTQADGKEVVARGSDTRHADTPRERARAMYESVGLREGKKKEEKRRRREDGPACWPSFLACMEREYEFVGRKSGERKKTLGKTRHTAI